MKPETIQTDSSLYSSSIENLVERILSSEKSALSAANRVMILTCWKIGRVIEETLKPGDIWTRARYDLAFKKAKALSKESGFVYGKRDVYYYRKFYKIFPDSKLVDLVCDQISWPHFRCLLRVADLKKRLWYLGQTIEENWSIKTLDHNIATQYYERLSLFSDQQAIKAEMKEKTAEFQKEQPEILKTASLLEFFGVSSYLLHETELESAILDELCAYLGSLNGFTLIQRQKHMMTETTDYYMDLVFYYAPTRQTVLIDLSLTKISFEQLGQMQLSINMFDDLEKEKGDGPTIGLVIGTEGDGDSIKYSGINESDRLYLYLLSDKQELIRVIEKGKQKAEKALIGSSE